MPALHFPNPPLADAVVQLRPWSEPDLPMMAEAFADPLVQRFSWPRATPYTLADAREYLAEQEQGRLRGEQIDFALVEPANHAEVLGGCSLYDVALDTARAAIGFWLTRGARGRGVATHAVRLIAHWAFTELALARIELTCSPDNHASQRVARRCGFSREGVLRSHTPFKGTRRDSVMFSLLADELR